MGSYLSSATTGPRQPRRLATSAIGLVAVIGLVTACTASSVGAAKRAPDRYPAGASAQAQAPAKTWGDTPETLRLEKQLRRALGTSVQAQAPAKTAGETEVTLRLEKAARRALNAAASRSKVSNAYELMRSESQHGK